MKKIISDSFELYENEDIEQSLTFFILINNIKTSFIFRFVTKSNKNCFVEVMRLYFKKLCSITADIIFNKSFLIMIINRISHITIKIIIFISNSKRRQIMR